MQIFAAEVLRELWIQAFARDLEDAEDRRVRIKDRNGHQLVNGSGWRRILSFGPDRLDRFKDAGVLYAGKIIKDLGFLAKGGVRGDCFAGNWNRPRSAKMLGKNELEQTA